MAKQADVSAAEVLRTASASSDKAAGILGRLREDLSFLKEREDTYTVPANVGEDPPEDQVGQHPSREQCVVMNLFVPTLFQSSRDAGEDSWRQSSFLDVLKEVERDLQSCHLLILPIQRETLSIPLADGDDHFVGGCHGPSTHQALLLIISQLHGLILRLLGGIGRNSSLVVKEFDALCDLLLRPDLDFVRVRARLRIERDVALRQLRQENGEGSSTSDAESAVVPSKDIGGGVYIRRQDALHEYVDPAGKPIPSSTEERWRHDGKYEFTKDGDTGEIWVEADGFRGQGTRWKERKHMKREGGR